MLLVNIFLYFFLYSNIIVQCKSQIKCNNEYSFKSTNNRTGKFLFDAIFRIGSGISNVFGDNVDEDTDYEDINVKTCDCGKCE